MTTTVTQMPTMLWAHSWGNPGADGTIRALLIGYDLLAPSRNDIGSQISIDGETTVYEFDFRDEDFVVSSPGDQPRVVAIQAHFRPSPGSPPPGEDPVVLPVDFGDGQITVTVAGWDGSQQPAPQVHFIIEPPFAPPEHPPVAPLTANFSVGIPNFSGGANAVAFNCYGTSVPRAVATNITEAFLCHPDTGGTRRYRRITVTSATCSPSTNPMTPMTRTLSVVGTWAADSTQDVPKCGSGIVMFDGGTGTITITIPIWGGTRKKAYLIDTL